MGDEADEPRDGWERTFQEREDEFSRLFGPSHPPGAREDHVISLNLAFPEDHPGVGLPGACVEVYRPDPVPAHADRVPRADWMYLTHGLSQPPGRGGGWGGVGLAREDARGLSGYGAEFAVLLREPQQWVPLYLRELMAYVYTTAPVRGGHRVPFGWYALPSGERTSGERTWFFGSPEEPDVRPLDDTRAMVFWPMLGPVGRVTTSTGTLDLLVGTSITGGEWQLAKQTTSAHLLLLLCRAGVGQRSVFGRRSVTDDPRLAREWESISRLSSDDACERLASDDIGA